MANTIQNIISKPVFTEKSEAFKYANKKKYYFLVDINANKLQIKQAFISIYMIEPDSINVIRRKPVWTKTGTRHPGFTKAKKIAIITLPKGISLAMTDDEVKEEAKETKQIEKKKIISKKKIVSENDNINESTDSIKE